MYFLLLYEKYDTHIKKNKWYGYEKHHFVIKDRAYGYLNPQIEWLPKRAIHQRVYKEGSDTTVCQRHKHHMMQHK